MVSPPRTIEVVIRGDSNPLNRALSRAQTAIRRLARIWAPMPIGARVMRTGWLAYPEWDHLARRGRVMHTPWPRIVEVRWDAGEFGEPAITRLHHVDELAWLWWRST